MSTYVPVLSPCHKTISIFADIYEPKGSPRDPICRVCGKSFDIKEGIPIPPESQPGSVCVLSITNKDIKASYKRNDND